MTKEIVKWKIKDLRQHPRQAAFFYDLPFHLLRDLAQDIEARGLKDPVEILPDGTIVCGHQRTRAGIQLGWEEIDVWINHDLAAQGELAIEQRLIEDNLVGRKMDRLDQVRCYRRLHDIAPETPDQSRRSHQLGRLRDVVGKRLNMSGRTLERYIRVLDAPREVQDAFRSGGISLVNASKVAGLPREAQEQLVADLRAGSSPKQAVAARLGGRAPSPLDAALGPFIRSLERNVETVEKHLDHVQSLCKYDTMILERAQDVIGKMLTQVKAKKPRAQKNGVKKAALDYAA